MRGSLCFVMAAALFFCGAVRAADGTDLLSTLRKATAEVGGDEQARERGLALFESVRGELESAPPSPAVARALYELGEALFNAGEAGAALQCLQLAVEMFERTGEAGDAAMASALTSLSTVATELGKSRQAVEAETRALRIREGLFGIDSVEAARSHSELGAIHWNFGRFSEAVPSLERARDIFVKGGSRIDHVRVLNRLGDSYRGMGRYDRARETLEEARRLAGTAGVDTDDRLEILNNLAGVHKDLGEYDTAQELLTLAYEQRGSQKQRNSLARADAAHNRAEVYRLQGEYEVAARLYDEALRIVDRTPDMGAGDRLSYQNQAAGLYSDWGRFDTAISRFGTIVSEAKTAIDAGTLDPADPVYSQIQHDFGVALDRGRRPAEAEQALREALKTRETHLPADHPDTAATMIALAETLASQTGKAGEALALAESAARILERFGNYPEEQSRADTVRARVLWLSGKRADAIDVQKAAVSRIEQLQPRAAAGDRSRAFFLTRNLSAYETLTGWLVDERRVAEALRYAEKSRARALLERLAVRREALTRGVPAETLQEHHLARAAVTEYQFRLDDPENDAGAGREQLLAGLRTSVDRLERARTRIRTQSIAWQEIAGRSERALDLEAIQRRGGLALYYEIGRDRSFVFILDADGLKVRQLTVGSGTSGAAPLTEAGLRQLYTNTLASVLRERATRGRVIARPAPARQNDLQVLWQALVPEDVRTRVTSAEELLIVPDGILHRLPFEMLVTGFSDGTPTYLLDHGPAVHYAPSFHTLADLRTRGAERHDSAAANTILIVTDPVHRIPSLRPLPGAAREAAKVEEMFVAAAASVTRLPGREATETAVRAAMPAATYLHFATHGLVREDLSSAAASLVLASETSTPDPGRDGLLQSWEIEELSLTARLTVLSACDTHFGDDPEAEGVFSMARAFLAAGSSSVIAGLWKVNDAATSELMETFYRLFLEDGYPAGKALSLAKQSMRKRYADPATWSPFVLIGSGEDQFAGNDDRSTPPVMTPGGL